MFTSAIARSMLASVALAMLLWTSAATAQDDEFGFIEAPTPAALDEAPTPAVLEPPADAQALEQAEPELLVPDAPSFDDDDLIDYRKGDVGSSKGGDCGCDSCNSCDCGGGCDSCGCGCKGGHDLFGCLRRMLQTCADHKRARCAGCYDKPCGCLGMTCKRGRRHDPNRTPAASGELFRQYYAQPRCGGVAAQMYVSPLPVPPAVGHTNITYQAFEPHQFMYRHKRKYVRRHGPGGGTTTTSVYWW